MSKKTGGQSAPPDTRPTERAKRSRVDWDAIEPHYRAGIRALKDIGAEFGVSDAGIIKHAREHGWDRNLKAKIQAKADAKVSAAMVSAEVSVEKKLTESVRVEVEAEVQARIRLSHRADIGRYRALALRLIEELEAQTSQVPELAQLGEVLRAPDERGMDKLNDLYQKIISLPSRSKVMKECADTLKVLIGLEREAYGIASVGHSDTPPLDTAPPTEDPQAYYAWLTKQGANGPA